MNRKPVGLTVTRLLGGVVLAALGCEAKVDRSLDGLACDTRGACAQGYVCRSRMCVPEGEHPVSEPELVRDAAPQASHREAGLEDAAGATSPLATEAGSSGVSSALATTDLVASSSACAGPCEGVSSEPGTGAGLSCTGETCGQACPEGLSPCSDGCHDLEVDVEHCGLCDRACVGPQEASIECRSRACVVTCPDAQKVCGDACVDTTRDIKHCGDCDRTCETSRFGATTCESGRCKLVCDDGYDMCGTECVDFTTDLAHCGDCNTVCRGKRVCVDGTCQTQ